MIGLIPFPSERPKEPSPFFPRSMELCHTGPQTIEHLSGGPVVIGALKTMACWPLKFYLLTWQDGLLCLSLGVWVALFVRTVEWLSVQEEHVWGTLFLPITSYRFLGAPVFLPAGLVALILASSLGSTAAYTMATLSLQLCWKEDPGRTKSATKLLKVTVICLVGSYLYLWGGPRLLQSLAALPSPGSHSSSSWDWQNVAGAASSFGSQNAPNHLVHLRLPWPHDSTKPRVHWNHLLGGFDHNQLSPASVSDSGGLGWSPRICISNKSSCNTDLLI